MSAAMAAAALQGSMLQTSHSLLRIGFRQPTHCRPTANPRRCTPRTSSSFSHIEAVHQCTFTAGWVGAKRRRISMRCAASTVTATSKEAEYSRVVNEELTLFLFQLEFDTQLQRALNYENFDAASGIRMRRQQVDEALDTLQKNKGEGAGASCGAHNEEASLASEGLRLRSEMQRAAEEERYQDAASIRDRLASLQERLGEVRAAGGAAGEAAERALRLGQRVIHLSHGYRGAICGWDERCCESEEWQRAAGIDRLARGAAQPFYHVLVDSRDWADVDGLAPLAYVAEELLATPEDGNTWLQEYGDDPFSHPYSYLLYLGTDHAGDLMPSRQLRDKYSAPRVDVWPPNEDGEGSDQQLPFAN